jgi:hypothetical protein
MPNAKNNRPIISLNFCFADKKFVLTMNDMLQVLV